MHTNKQKQTALEAVKLEPTVDDASHLVGISTVDDGDDQELACCGELKERSIFDRLSMSQ